MHVRAAPMLVTALVAVSTAACTTGTGDPAPVPPSSAVVQPGSPGEANATLGPDELADRQGPSDYEQADVDFMTQMITHHLQALEMSALAPERAEDPRVTALADRIGDVQGSEVHGLASWLDQRDLPVPADVEQGDGSGPRAVAPHDHTDHHDAGSMPGMLSDAQLEALRAADGAEFDRLYLQGMIQHHQGAVDMARTVMSEGVDERVEELATEIGAGQEAEIGRMKDLLRGR